MQELEIIKNYFSKLSKNNQSSCKLNDDVFFDKNKKLVISTDTYVEGIHFLDFDKPELVIKKIIRSSISDLICKGVKPKYYFIAVSGHKLLFTKTNLEKILKSLNEEQKKYKILLSGGDTVFSKKITFTITSIGFSKKIVFRNQAKLFDDIYTTGNLGDSYIGLQILKKKIKLNKNLEEYFIKKYYLPDIQYKLSQKLLNFANTSMDISDGLVSDLEKLINNQKLSYKLYLDDIPISNNLNNVLMSKNFLKKDFISNGDDYQILFTAHSNKKEMILKIAKSLGIRITKIGKICSPKEKSSIIDKNKNKVEIKNKGYIHYFKT